MDLHLKVKPNARQNRIFYENGGLVAQIKAVPAEGQANKALILYLSTIFDIPRSKIEIATGAGSRFKKIIVPSEYDGKISEVLAELRNGR